MFVSCKLCRKTGAKHRRKRLKSMFFFVIKTFQKRDSKKPEKCKKTKKRRIKIRHDIVLTHKPKNRICMKRLIKLLTLGTLMLTGTLVMAQRTITGNVKWNENGQAAPLPGANVIADGNAVGTITDADGNFTLDVPESVSALTFSSIGLKSQTINIAGQSVIDVTMENDVKTLDEVVVVGYGTQKAKD